jgi:uridylate kinase|tara:strand:- start:14345 stop:15061 length:717 start_codon:yes stop_codon:yes gene_type:complete
MENKSQYKRILFKVSGEAMMGNKAFGHDKEAIEKICDQITEVYNLGYEICIVVGGGNIFRGISAASEGMERASADYMGMLATSINSMALQNILEKNSIPTRIQSAIPMNTICETYAKRKAVRHLEKKRVVIFAAGTGNPFFTTDTAAILRAIETNCDAVFKGTQVDGVYSSDPKKNKEATRFDQLTYNDVIKKDLKVMDQTAITLAKDNNLPIIVFSISTPSALKKVLSGDLNFTIIK